MYIHFNKSQLTSLHCSVFKVKWLQSYLQYNTLKACVHLQSRKVKCPEGLDRLNRFIEDDLHVYKLVFINLLLYSAIEGYVCHNASFNSISVTGFGLVLHVYVCHNTTFNSILSYIMTPVTYIGGGNQILLFLVCLTSWLNFHHICTLIMLY